MKIFNIGAAVVLTALLAASCTKYKEINDEAYPDQNVYLPAAVEGNSVKGVYFINRVAVPGQVYRYQVDAAAKRLRIPLAAYRSGVDTKGAIEVSVSADADTANRMLLAGTLPAGSELLPAGKYEVPSSVTIPSGASDAGFDLSVDLDYLVANPTKKFALGVGINSNSKLPATNRLAVVLIDASFLVPVANFTTSVSGRTVSFSNTSLNGISYTWNYGDGSATSTAIAAPYTYAAAGTYTVKLTATGALGATNPSVKTATVTVL